MKRNLINMALMAAAVITLTNCAKEFEAPVQPVEPVGIPFEVTALTSETKTANVENSWSTAWVEGDQIKLCHALTGEKVYTMNTPFTNVGGNRFTGELLSELDENASYDWVAVYPYSEDHTTDWSVIEYAAETTQNGYDSKAHLAGENCPMYASATAVPAGEIPALRFKHMSAVVAVEITNVDDEVPAVITEVMFSTGNTPIAGTFAIDDTELGADYGTATSAKVKVNVVGGTELAINGEGKATVYMPVKPFTVHAGDVLTIWVNGIPQEIAIEQDRTFEAGKVYKATYEYKNVPAPAYWYAKASSTMDGTRVEFDVRDIFTWAQNLKDKENTLETLKAAVEAVQNKNYVTAYELLGGVPGFVKAVKTFNGEGEALVKIDYTATDFVGGFTEKVKDINNVEDLKSLLNDIEDTYEVSDLNSTIDETLEKVESYIPDNIKNSIIYKGIKNYVEDLTLTGLLDQAMDNKLLAAGINWMFENNEFRNRILDAVEGVVSKIEEAAKEQFDADNQLLRETAEALAKNEAESQAKVAAKRAAQDEWDATNQSNVAKLHRTPWGIYKAIIVSATCENAFVKLEIVDVYEVLLDLAAEVEGLVKYDEGAYSVEIIESKKVLASEIL